MTILYDFDLMEGGGHVAGWLLDDESVSQVANALRSLNEPKAFRARYGFGEDVPPLQFAVGDGNHSLATAKECYERQKRYIDEDKWADLPARYALCEVVDLHDEALEFEPIHRVVFHVKEKDLLDALLQAFPDAHPGEGEGHVLRWVSQTGEGAVTVPHPAQPLAVGTLQAFLDDYVARHGGSIDYIHGGSVARELGRRAGNMAFLLPVMTKEELFPAVIRGGVLPRKTFSMGEAADKRFYLEARKIR